MDSDSDEEVSPPAPGPPDIVVLRHGSDPSASTSVPAQPIQADRSKRLARQPAASQPTTAPRSPSAPAVPSAPARPNPQAKPLPAISFLARSSPSASPESSSEQIEPSLSSTPTAGPPSTTSKPAQQQQQVPFAEPRAVLDQLLEQRRQEQKQPRPAPTPELRAAPPSTPGWPSAQPAQGSDASATLQWNLDPSPEDRLRSSPPDRSLPLSGQADRGKSASDAGQQQQLKRQQQPQIQQQQFQQQMQQEQAQQAERQQALRQQQTRAGVSDLDFFAKQGFPDVGAARELVSGLSGMGITSPSHIQAEAFQVRHQQLTLRLNSFHGGHTEI